MIERYMIEFKQFIIPTIFVVVMSLVFRVGNMSDGLGKLCVYFLLALFPVLIIQLNNVKKLRLDIGTMDFVATLIAYTLYTLTFSIVLLTIFSKN